jgi:hypothetical protein
MVRNPFMFYANTRREVIPRGTKKRARIPQQLSEAKAEAIENLMATTYVAMSVTMLPTLIILPLTGGLAEIWGTINSL